MEFKLEKEEEEKEKPKSKGGGGGTKSGRGAASLTHKGLVYLNFIHYDVSSGGGRGVSSQWPTMISRLLESWKECWLES